MYNKLILYLAVFVVVLSISGCGCKHEWVEANCVQPKTCKICGETAGEPLGHDFEEATCTTPKTCRFCGATEGKPIGHDFEEATCTTPKTCRVCGETGGEALGHDFEEGYCTRCGLEDPDYFNPEEYGFINNYGMTMWIEITKYSIGGEDEYAMFEEDGHTHGIYEFKDNVLYDYSCFDEGKTSDEYQFSKTSDYTIINNNSIKWHKGTITIFDRQYDSNGNLIIKVMYGGYEMWFILEDQIDWDKSPVVENITNAWQSFKYFYK